MIWAKTLAASAALFAASAANAVPVRYEFQSSFYEFSLVSPDFVTEFTPPVTFEAAEMESCTVPDSNGETGRCHSVSFQGNIFIDVHELVLRATFETVSRLTIVAFDIGTFARFGTFTPIGALPAVLTISAADETPVPAPSAAALIGLGAVGLAALRRRKA